jgi:hypothetical protein
MSGKLLEPGTKLADAPPDWQGVPAAEWEALRLREMCAERDEARKSEPRPAFPDRRISGSRDNYGWRSLPGGTAYFGPPRK